MGRNSKRLRPQDYPTHDEMDYEEEIPRPKRASSSVPQKSAMTSFREGQVVTISSKGTDGTIFCIGSEVILVLDSVGFIYELRPHEIYKSQTY